MDKVTILGISASHRKNKTTDGMLKECLKSAEMLGPWVKTEFICLMDYTIKPCIACLACLNEIDASGDPYCTLKDDVPKLLKKMLQADGIIAATPIYFGGMSGLLKVFIDRTLPFAHGANTKYRGALEEKVGGALAIGLDPHGGMEVTIDDIHHWYFTHGMTVVGTGYHHPHGCYIGGVIGKAPYSDAEGYKHDTFGMRSVRGLGKNVAEMALVKREGVRLIRSLKEFEVKPEVKRHEEIEIDWDKYYSVMKHFPQIHIGVPGKVASSRNAIDKYLEWNIERKGEKVSETLGEDVGTFLDPEKFKRWLLEDIGLILVSDDEMYRHDPEYFEEYLKTKP